MPKQIVIEFNDGPHKMWVAVYEQYSLVFRVKENETPEEATVRHRMNYALKTVRPANAPEIGSWLLEHPKFRIKEYKILE